MSDQTVHIVDDDAPTRESVEFLLAAEGLATRIYDGARALLERLDELEPGCVVTDIRMPGMSGLELAAELKRRGAAHPIIVLTGHGDVALAVQAMKLGAQDFLEKPYDGDALLRAVRAALSLDESEASRRQERREIAKRASQLTQREREVFEAVVTGDSNKAAALKLNISPRTVEIYRANVMAKMQADTLSDLVRMALQLGQT